MDNGLPSMNKNEFKSLMQQVLAFEADVMEESGLDFEEFSHLSTSCEGLPREYLCHPFFMIRLWTSYLCYNKLRAVAELERFEAAIAPRGKTTLRLVKK